MESLTRAALSELLDRRNAEPDRAEELDREIWQRCGADRGVLVLDLSGFTRLTRKRGILHFLSVYRRAARLTLPIVQAHHGRLVKGEADNVIGSYPTAVDAFASALQMQRAAAELNKGLADDDQVRLCIAVGFGRILELADDFFGDEVNVTFKLGEDVARAGEVFVTEAAFRQLAASGTPPRAEAREIELGGVPARYYVVEL